MDESGKPPTWLRGLDSRYHVNCGSGMRGQRTPVCQINFQEETSRSSQKKNLKVPTLVLTQCGSNPSSPDPVLAWSGVHGCMYVYSCVHILP